VRPSLPCHLLCSFCAFLRFSSVALKQSITIGATQCINVWAINYSSHQQSKLKIWPSALNDSPSLAAHLSNSVGSFLSISNAVTEKIEGLTYGSSCRIHLLRGHVEGDWIVV
jgi:hypothetical protein